MNKNSLYSRSMRMIFHRNETTVICAVNYSRGYSIASDSGQFSYIRIFVLLFLARSRASRALLVSPSSATHAPIASRGLEKSRRDWSSSEASRSGRFGILKARRKLASSVSITSATSAGVLSSSHLSADYNGLNRLRDRKA